MKLGLMKFKYGEEILTQYEKVPGGYKIQNAAAMMPAENFHYHLITWMPYTTIKDGFVLPEEQIWFVVDVSFDMIDYYHKWLAALEKTREMPVDQITT